MKRELLNFIKKNLLPVPKISIITVNLNNLEGLQKTMESVLKQSWQEFEYIIIDGGSTDGSKEYINNNKDSLDSWLCEKDSGIYNAMNKGIKKANGEYLLFLNSGDEFYNDKVLEENIAYIHTEDFIYFDIFLIFADESKIHRYPELLNFDSFLYGSLGHPTTFIKRDLFNRIGLYDESLRIVSDWKFFIIAILKYNCSTRKINTVLSKFNMNGISFNNEEEVQFERRKVLKAEFYDNLRLLELESLLLDLKKSRIIIFFRRLGFLKLIDKVN